MPNWTFSFSPQQHRKENNQVLGLVKIKHCNMMNSLKSCKLPKYVQCKKFFFIVSASWNKNKKKGSLILGHWQNHNLNCFIHDVISSAQLHRKENYHVLGLRNFFILTSTTQKGKQSGTGIGKYKAWSHGEFIKIRPIKINDPRCHLINSTTQKRKQSGSGIGENQAWTGQFSFYTIPNSHHPPLKKLFISNTSRK